MPFKRGNSGNPNGRPAGSPNKTKPLRDQITAFVNGKWDSIEEDFESLDPKERIQLFIKLLSYTIPQLSAVNVTNDLERQLEVLSNDQLEDLMNKILDNYKNS